MTPPSENRPKTFDSVDNPFHYASGGVETIEAIEASMTPEAFRGFLKGNVMKYVWRYENKNGLEDLKKAKWYLKALIFALEMEQEKEALDTIEGNCKDGFCPMPGASSPDTIVGVRFDDPPMGSSFFDPIYDR